MINICKQADLAYDVVIPPSKMGIHPSNRAGKRMKGSDVQKKGKKIHTVGFTMQLCGTDRAIAFENHPQTNRCEAHTLSITSADPVLGKYKPSTIRGGSVGCGHLNQWLHAVGYRAKSPYSHLCKADSDTMCAARVCGNDEQSKQAISQGLKWCMLRVSHGRRIYPFCRAGAARLICGTSYRRRSSMHP